MGSARFVERGDLSRLLEGLAEGRRVYSPRKEGDAVLFRSWSPGGALSLERSTVPPKDVIFPRCETLLGFTREKDAEDLGRTSLRLDATAEAGPALIFGCRPCDARGFAVIDRVYLEGPVRDPYYAARRGATIVVTLACARPAPTCFCHWVGSGPDDTTGSDLLLTEVDDGYVVEAVTGRGNDLLAQMGLPKAGDRLSTARGTGEAARAALEAASPAPDLSASAMRLAERFDDSTFWRDMSDKCLSCGACTYLCPTCYCFNITDENDGGDGMRGKRLRSWDTCMSPLFSREASGHNPRGGKAMRLRNRVGHKFSYYPKLHEGAVACNGCGRCIVSCPVSVDIREILLCATRHDPESAKEKSDV